MKSVCCDALGTLIDISAITTQLEQQYPGQGIRIADLWRTKQVDYSRLRALGGQYKPFGKITQDALEATFLELRIVYSPHDLDTAMGQYLSGVAFPDARNFLDALKIPWSILTNGDRNFIQPILSNAGIDCPETHLLTSDQVETFKVDKGMYELTWSWAQECGTSLKSDVIFISANQWDAIAASWFGFTSCWINRTGQSPEKLGASPLFEVSSMSEIGTAAWISTCDRSYRYRIRTRPRLRGCTRTSHRTHHLNNHALGAWEQDFASPVAPLHLRFHHHCAISDPGSCNCHETAISILGISWRCSRGIFRD